MPTVVYGDVPDDVLLRIEAAQALAEDPNMPDDLIQLAWKEVQQLTMENVQFTGMTYVAEFKPRRRGFRAWLSRVIGGYGE